MTGDSGEAAKVFDHWRLLVPTLSAKSADKGGAPDKDGGSTTEDTGVTPLIPVAFADCPLRGGAYNEDALTIDPPDCSAAWLCATAAV